MGWNIPNPKTIEVRKSYPKDKQWNHKVLIYCTNDKKSFQQIPKQYQPTMKAFLGKVVGEFVCDDVYKWRYEYDGVDIDEDTLLETMVEWEDINIYAHGKTLYGWNISNLKIYDESKELGDFIKVSGECVDCKQFEAKDLDGYCRKYEEHLGYYDGFWNCDRCLKISRPPQSWMYIKEAQSRRDEWYEPETIVLFNSDHQPGCARAYCPRCGVYLGECNLADPLGVLDYQRRCPVCGAKIKAEPTK